MSIKQLTEHQMTLKEQLEHGDVTKLSDILNVTTRTIHNVLSGKRKGNYVWVELESFLKDRAEKRAERANSVKESL